MILLVFLLLNVSFVCLLNVVLLDRDGGRWRERERYGRLFWLSSPFGGHPISDAGELNWSVSGLFRMLCPDSGVQKRSLGFGLSVEREREKAVWRY